ncbi:hypothetical protein KGQ19_19355 [Catenulispora sp. NL8]|uniref:Lipoprotein n=1 Tax=Catenulispora pinistramenti TaxID=2705254 RepID=A0ABS5KSK5_9ACTN|nr:hypothetical protein [Catenulispora pinistramenti]MBS2549027.1 hypothetical protein [Catenulispora pinistramenti]
MARRPALVALATVMVIAGAAGCGGGSKNYKSQVSIEQIVPTDQVDFIVTGLFTNPYPNKGVTARVTLNLHIQAAGKCAGGAGDEYGGQQSPLDFVAPGATVTFQLHCSGYLPSDPSPSLAEVEKVTIGDPDS